MVPAGFPVRVIGSSNATSLPSVFGALKCVSPSGSSASMSLSNRYSLHSVSGLTFRKKNVSFHTGSSVLKMGRVLQLHRHL
jgi:hypothetical protein